MAEGDQIPRDVYLKYKTTEILLLKLKKDLDFESAHLLTEIQSIVQHLNNQTSSNKSTA